MLICLNQEQRTHDTKITTVWVLKVLFTEHTKRNSQEFFYTFVPPSVLKFKMFILRVLWYSNLLVSVFFLLCHALGLQHLASWVHNRFQINQIRAYHSQRKCFMSVLRRDG